MPLRVLITGGASGFGHALAQIYAARGERVLVTDLAPQITAAELPEATGDGDIQYRQLDVRDAVAWEAAKDWVVDHWGGLDVLVNNAGVAAGGRFDVVPFEDWQWIIDINLLGVVRGCQTFTPLFKQQRSGQIVNVASVAGLVHAPHMSSYNVVKAGVVALSETLLHELSPYDVDVSVVCPSFFRSNLDKSLRGSDPALEETAKKLISKAPRSAETVAKRTIRALDKGRYLVRPQVDAVAFHSAKRFAAPVYHAAMKRAAAGLDKKARQRDATPTQA